MSAKKEPGKRWITRRNFFRHFFWEAYCVAEEVRGKPQMLLSDLPALEDHVIGNMKPVLQKANGYFINKGELLFKDSKMAEPKEVKRFDEYQNFILGWFNGNHTVSEISKAYAVHFKITEQDAFVPVKNLFITLSKYMVCCPAHAHDDEKREDKS